MSMNRRNLFGLFAALPVSIFAPKVAAKTWAGLDVSGAEPLLLIWPAGVFVSGTDFVQRDGLAYLHRGERIPSWQGLAGPGAARQGAARPGKARQG